MALDSIEILPGEPVPSDVKWTPLWEQQLKNEVKYSGQYKAVTDEGEYNIVIWNDEDPENPREWDNIGTIVYWHRRYTLGEQNGREAFGDPEEFANEAKAKGYIMLPVSLYDHSGLSMYVGSKAHYTDPGGWDSGQVGWIYVKKEKAMEEFNWKRITEERKEHILKLLRGEVETYDQYLKGDVAGFTVEDPDGDNIDSCGGFYGREGIADAITEHIIPSIRNNIDARIKGRAYFHNQQFNYLKRIIKAKVPLIYRKPFNHQ